MTSRSEMRREREITRWARLPMARIEEMLAELRAMKIPENERKDINLYSPKIRRKIDNLLWAIYNKQMGDKKYEKN